MVDVHNRHKLCKHAGCTTRASFNFPGIKKGEYCDEHKKDDMIDVIGKRCLHEGCPNRSSFNFPGELTQLYCSKYQKQMDITRIVSC